MNKSDIEFKYNYIINEFEKLFKDILLEKNYDFCKNTTNFISTIFMMKKIYPRRTKSF